MAHFAGASWEPLGKQSQPLMRAHDIICIHTMVGSLDGTDDMFEDGGYTGTESHLGTGPKGEAKQWQDIKYTADANLDGNGTVISIENADRGTGFPAWDMSGDHVPPFTDPQMRRIEDLVYQGCLPGTNPKSVHRDCPKNWDCYRVGIPAKLIPNTRPSSRGIGYHAQGVEGNGLVVGGVKWSKSRGKVCPGAKRIAQVKAIIIPRVAARLAGKDNDMPLDADTKKWLLENVGPKPVWDFPITQAGRTRDAQVWMGWTNEYVHQILNIVQDPTTLASKIAAKLPPGSAVSQEVLQAALTEVFGSLNDKEKQ